jgi:hypothetical protein
MDRSSCRGRLSRSRGSAIQIAWCSLATPSGVLQVVVAPDAGSPEATRIALGRGTSSMADVLALSSHR